MVFKCQEDSFLRQFTTKVKSVEKAEKGFNVIFDDTILFPEGGGQPADHGTAGNFQVSNVVRKGAEAIHYIEFTSDQPPFAVGEEVTQTVDWTRRQDHMQQHSGQHLITAVFEREFKIITKSWWLGTETSYIEVETKDVTEQQLKHVEKIVNELIAAATPVKITLLDAKDPAMDSVRSNKDVPEDVVGPLRVCDIQGVDRNLCCGTHVSNLSQLQLAKLLHVEKSKTKTLVHFLVGNRVLARLQRCLEREQQMNLALNGGPESHLELVKKITATAKSNTRLLKNLAKEVAAFEIEKFSASAEKRFYIIHRHDGIDNDFLTSFMRIINAPDTLFFVTLGDEKQGSFVLQGPEVAITALGGEICALLDGKGNGKGSKFQGKANNLKKTPDCDKLIKKYFEIQ